MIGSGLSRFRLFKVVTDLSLHQIIVQEWHPQAIPVLMV
jgi:hypothetical protein